MDWADLNFVGVWPVEITLYLLASGWDKDYLSFGCDMAYIVPMHVKPKFTYLLTYIFILDLTPGFNGLGRDNWTRQGLFKFWVSMSLILEILRYIEIPYSPCEACWALSHWKDALVLWLCLAGD